LVGGGLIRSAGGWSAVQAMRRAQDHMKSDERILGDGEFTQFVLDEAKERLEERYRLQAQGYDLDKVSKKLGVSQPSVSISVKRGEKIAKTEQLELGES
jgi:REP-associated tyrosine transposase